MVDDGSTGRVRPPGGGVGAEHAVRGAGGAAGEPGARRRPQPRPGPRARDLGELPRPGRRARARLPGDRARALFRRSATTSSSRSPACCCWTRAARSPTPTRCTPGSTGGAAWSTSTTSRRRSTCRRRAFFRRGLLLAARTCASTPRSARTSRTPSSPPATWPRPRDRSWPWWPRPVTSTGAGPTAPRWCSRGWGRQEKYTLLPRVGYLRLLEELAARGPVPVWAQNLVLYDLLFYFREDQRMHAATAGLDAETQRHVPRAGRRPSWSTSTRSCWPASTSYPHGWVIAAGPAGGLPAAGRRPAPAAPVATRHRPADRSRSATSTGRGRPARRFTVGGRPVEPVHAKVRDLVFFGRVLAHQRIVWLPATSAAAGPAGRRAGPARRRRRRRAPPGRGGGPLAGAGRSGHAVVGRPPPGDPSGAAAFDPRTGAAPGRADPHPRPRPAGAVGPAGRAQPARARRPRLGRGAAGACRGVLRHGRRTGGRGSSWTVTPSPRTTPSTSIAG